MSIKRKYCYRDDIFGYSKSFKAYNVTKNIRGLLTFYAGYKILGSVLIKCHVSKIEKNSKVPILLRILLLKF